MTATDITTANWDRTTATFNVATVADLVCMSASTVRRWASNGKLEAVWETPNRPRFTVTGVARFLAERQGGELRVPLNTAAFGNTQADTMQAFAVRLSIFADLRKRVMLDRDGKPLGGLYTPGEEEYAHHYGKLTAETDKAGLI